MQVNFGLDSGDYSKGKQTFVTWDSKKVINAHMLVVGKTGTGKTHTLRKIIQEMIDSRKGGQKFRVRIIDVHGDIEVPNCSTVKFSETSDYGFNPLAVNPDPEYGGVRRRIQSFISILNKTSRKLGTKQEPALRNILKDLYAANGFYENDPKSWSIVDLHGRPLMHNGKQKKYPTLEDAYRYANFKHNAMYLGSNNRTTLLLEKVNKLARKMNASQKKGYKALTADDLAEQKEQIKLIGEEAVQSFSEHITSIETGREFSDLLKYDSIETMKSIVNRLESLLASGIFKNRIPEFDPNSTVWRYNIKPISDYDEKKMFVYFLLEEIYLKCFQEGEQDDVVEMVFLDEANLFFSDEADNIINIISKEARKFGMGLCCASQSPTHFSEDFMSSVGTKVILGIDQLFWNGSVQKLKIDQKALEWIVPQKKLVIQINNKGELRNNFSWVLIK